MTEKVGWGDKSIIEVTEGIVEVKDKSIVKKTYKSNK